MELPSLLAAFIHMFHLDFELHLYGLFCFFILASTQAKNLGCNWHTWFGYNRRPFYIWGIDWYLYFAIPIWVTAFCSKIWSDRVCSLHHSFLMKHNLLDMKIAFNEYPCDFQALPPKDINFVPLKQVLIIIIYLELSWI